MIILDQSFLLGPTNELPVKAYINPLSHYPLGDVALILNVQLSNYCRDWFLKYVQWYCL